MIRSSLMFAACVAPMLAATPALAVATGLSLDTTFGNPALNGPVYAAAVDSSGRILLGGAFTMAGTTPTARSGLARFNANGTLDTSFADPNITGTPSMQVNAIAIDREGKIVVGGTFDNAGGQAYGNIARFNTDGTVDTTFVNPNLNTSTFGLAIDGNDKIVLVGEFGLVNSVDHFGLARLNADGSNDMANDPSINVGPAKVSGVAIDSTGRIVVGGDFTSAGATTRNRIARFNSDGTLDTSFNPNLNGNVMSLAIDGSDRIVIAGDFTTIGGGATTRRRLARLSSNGSVDSSFADPAILSQVWSVKLDQNGNIVVGGEFTSAGGQARSVLARYASDGTLDTTFVPPTFSGGATATTVRTIALDTQGRLIVGGIFSGVGDTLNRYHAARLTQTYPLTVATAGPGSVTSSVGGISCGATCSADIETGTSVTLTATAGSGYSFSGWSGDCSGATTTSTFTLTANRSCTATFSIIPPPPPPPPPTQVTVPVDTAGSGQGSVSLAAALGNPGPGASFTVQQTSGAPLPTWLSFDSATLSFAYDVPVPSDLPIQPAAADVRATRPTIPNRVYPLSVLVQTVPVMLTVTTAGATSSYVVNMSFYAPRSPVVTTAVSYSATGRSGDGASGRPVLSWDGGQILFETVANNLFAATSTSTKIGRYHGVSGQRDLLSQTAIPGGGVANATNGPATAPAVSANGAWGAFAAAGGGVTITPSSTLRQIFRTSLAYPRVALNEAVTPAAAMVSTTATGTPANAAADNPVLSEDGALVAFESAATNLGANLGGTVQIWRKDIASGALVLVSAAADGTAGNGDSRNVSLSWDGRYAAFDSTATNLVAGVSGRQVYLKDLQTGAVFVIAAGSQPRLDARATSVVFTSGSQVMRFDRATGRSGMIAGNADQPAISADGRFVVWRATGDAYTQIWVRDVFRDQTALVSQTVSGTPGSGNSYDPAISGDGATIGFGSQARDLVNGNPLSGQIHVAANPLLLPGRTDYWYVTAGGNQAWAIERWGNQAYIANMAYQPGGGVATWTAGLCQLDGLVCRGTLAQTGADVAVTFDQAGTAASLAVNGGSAQSLAIYPILGTSTTAFAGLPQGGWWYEPAQAAERNGVFLAFDTQVGTSGTVSQTAHLTLLTYDAAGVPVWYAAEGVLGSDLSLEGTLMRYAGGAAIGTTGGAVAPSSTAIGPFRLAFPSGDSATLRLPDGRTAALTRFRF